MTDRYAVLGQPISHSRSPRIHALFAEQTGAALTYGAIEVAPESLAESLKRLHDEGYAGLNLTSPHKAAAIALCESISEASRRAGSVNTLVRTAAGWRGENTDGSGLLRDLRDTLGVAIDHQRVLVIGAGGAARGILEPLLASKPALLVISSRNPWKPEAIAEAMKPLGNIVPRTHVSLKGDQFDLVINATSAGHAGEVPRLPPHLFAAGAVAYDLNYGPASKPFLDWAQAQGASRTADGLGMLVEQAADAFALWRSTRPLTAEVLEAIR